MKKKASKKLLRIVVAITSVLIFAIVLKLGDAVMSGYYYANVGQTLSDEFERGTSIATIFENDQLVYALPPSDKKIKEVTTLVQLLETDKFLRASKYIKRMGHISQLTKTRLSQQISEASECRLFGPDQI